MEPDSKLDGKLTFLDNKKIIQINTFSIEKQEGYILALLDFIEELNDVIFVKFDENVYADNSTADIKNNIIALINNKSKTISILKND